VIPLTVREAPQGSTWGAEVLQLPGVELLRASLERRLPDPPVTKLTGQRRARWLALAILVGRREDQ
jgi:hypothetical protein